MTNLDNKQIVSRVLLDFNVDLYLTEENQLKIKYNHKIGEADNYVPLTNATLSVDSSLLNIVQNDGNVLKQLCYENIDKMVFVMDINRNLVLSVDEDSFYYTYIDGDYIYQLWYRKEKKEQEIKTSKKLLKLDNDNGLKAKEKEYINYNVKKNRAILLCCSDKNDSNNPIVIKKEHADALLKKIISDKSNKIYMVLHTVKENFPYTYRIIRNIESMKFIEDVLKEKDAIDMAKQYIKSNTSRKNKNLKLEDD